MAAGLPSTEEASSLTSDFSMLKNTTKKKLSDRRHSTQGYSQRFFALNPTLFRQQRKAGCLCKLTQISDAQLKKKLIFD